MERLIIATILLSNRRQEHGKLVLTFLACLLLLLLLHIITVSFFNFLLYVAEKWQVCSDILSPSGTGNECCERLAYYGINTNLVNYLKFQMNESNVVAVNNVTNWSGTCYVTPLLGAFLADAYLGRYWTIATFSAIYVFGMTILTLSASVHGLKPFCDPNDGCHPTGLQIGVFYAGLYLIALGTGGIKPCVSSFGADQFDDSDEVEKKNKSSFFNWFYFSINIGALVASTVLVWIQTNVGWGWGFGIPAVAMAIAVVSFFSGTRLYRNQRPGGSPLTRICQVVVASVRKIGVDVPKDKSALYETAEEESAVKGSRKLEHTKKLSFFDKAAVETESDARNGSVNPWRLCTVTQVEELKSIIRLLPIWATGIIFSTVYSQMGTLFVLQGNTMDLHLIKSFEIPSASLSLFDTISVIFWVPVYDQIIVPFARKFTGNKNGFTQLQRIAIGLVISIFAMLVAGTLEMIRLNIVKEHNYYEGMALLTLSASVPGLKPECNTNGCHPNSLQTATFFVAIYLIALGTGGIKPCVSSFGADQFDDNDEREKRKKSSFFNWFYLSINIGAMIASSVLVWMQMNVGWNWGFGIPAVSMAIAVAFFFLGSHLYRLQIPGGSPLTRIFQVLVASIKKYNVKVPTDKSLLYETADAESSIQGSRKLEHTDKFRCLDKAAVETDTYSSLKGVVNPWSLCTVTQVEELKSIIGLLPVWASGIVFSTVSSQMGTLFVLQGNTMDQQMGPNFKIPSASLSLFNTLSVIFWAPVYDQLQRMGIGLVIATFAMIVAGLLEVARLDYIRRNNYYDQPTIPMSIFWQVPQYFLVGCAEVFTNIGQLEFFYDQAPDAMRSLSSALALTTHAVGHYLSSALVIVVTKLTTKHGQLGWIPKENLNRGHLDYFYWLLVILSSINFFVYLFIAKWYTYKKAVAKDP
ncbi:UNVERIFIED_CONTAM: protein NRT1/ PTR FAMILY 8.1 [Sesamum latifolium]|uniref:Protein NRT1/ PTR FAMILY 8.1 n=1 Tax=Sesamum latifolium TaxID=2727402 RepID=A0AAW2XCU0_9LAMI